MAGAMAQWVKMDHSSKNCIWNSSIAGEAAEEAGGYSEFAWPVSLT